MALTVESGSGDPAAEAYVSVSHVDTYTSNRGFTVWAAASTADKEAAIRRATDHIERMYGHRFRGDRKTQDQALSWPRIGAYMNSGYEFDAVPRALEKACAEYAVRALNYGVLTPDIPATVPTQSLTSGETITTYTSLSGRLSGKKEKVGPLETEYSVAVPTIGDMPKYAAADRYLTELLRNPLNGKLVRG